MSFLVSSRFPFSPLKDAKSSQIVFALSWAGQLRDTAREQVCFVPGYDGVAWNPKPFQAMLLIHVHGRRRGEVGRYGELPSKRRRTVTVRLKKQGQISLVTFN